jgi:hypothetical protein
MSDPLSTYLHDHLGGAKAALDLLEAMRDGHKDAALKDFAAYLLMEVQADRDTLQRLAEQVGSGSDTLKEFSGWFAEKVTRLKLGQGSGEDSGHSRPWSFWRWVCAESWGCGRLWMS